MVATPIGNMEDITLRAVKALKEVDLIAAEDTRHTKKLLTHYGVSTPLTSYFEHNEREKAPELIGKMKSGAAIALVSDAGTPGISDPGYRLIKLAIENSIEVVPIPGPSALITVLSVSGLPLDEFTFKGFFPAKNEELKKFLLGLKGGARTYAMYESPRRIARTLELILDILGDIDIVIAREMTKLHEEVLRGRVSVVIGMIRGRELKGEITVVLRTKKERAGGISLVEEIESLLRSGFKLKDVVKAVADELDMPKSEVYKEALKVKDRLKTGGLE